MSAPPDTDITVVLPTYNRSAALRQNIGTILELDGVGEIIVIDDGSSDDTARVCEECADARLRLIRHERNQGVARARNTGVAAATGSWVLFGEDDCRFPKDYATTLRSQAERNGADIIGAPLIHHEGTEQEIATIAQDRPRSTRRPSLDHVDTFVAHTVETPFLHALALIRRQVFDSVSFYEGYPVNGFREETDFFVQAARSGFKCMLTGETYCYQLDSWDGGQHHSTPLRYEYWLLRNNWRFLKRQGRWLRAHGHIRSTLGAQAGFTVRRCASVLRGVLRARFAGLRSRLTPGR